MTEQDQYLACAELDGWVVSHMTDMHGNKYWRRVEDVSETGNQWRRFGDYPKTHEPLNYSTRDAVIGVIEKQNGPIGNTFEYRFVQCLLESIPGMRTRGVSHLSFPEVYFLIRSTPAQLREALLRATGKWKEQWRKDPEP